MSRNTLTRFAALLVLAGAVAACNGSDIVVGPTPTTTSTRPTASSTPTRSPTETQTRMLTCTPTRTGTPPPVGSPTPTFGGPTPRFLTHVDPTPPGVVTDYWPRFSPDGSTILFTRTFSNTQTGQSEKAFLVTVPSAGGQAQEFPPPGPTRTPIPVSATRNSWSWNTSLTEHQIAFTGESGEGGFLYLISADGSGLEQVRPPGTGTQVDYPSWYPNGVDVAVVDYGDTPGTPAGVLRRIDTRANTAEQLTDLSAIYAGEPAVSRHATRIAFAGQLNCGPYNQSYNQIWLLDLTTRAVSQLDPQEGRTPDWSPDDQYLSYETTRFCRGGNYAIIIEKADGSVAWQATDCVYNGNHSVWSPDMKTLAFSAVIPDTPNRGIAVIPVPDLSAPE